MINNVVRAPAGATHDIGCTGGRNPPDRIDTMGESHDGIIQQCLAGIIPAGKTMS